MIGLAMGFAVERLMNSMLFNAGGVDLLVYLVVVPSMVLVTMLAAYVPARQSNPDRADSGAAMQVVLWGEDRGGISGLPRQAPSLVSRSS